MKNTIVSVLFGLAFTAVAQTNAPPKAPAATPAATSESSKTFGLFDDSWRFSIDGGQGVTTTTGNSESIFGIDIGLGKRFEVLDLKRVDLEVGVRQGVNYDSHGEDTTLLTTKPYADVNYAVLKNTELFGGVNFGMLYGNTPFLWTVAPEGGVRYWLTHGAAVMGRVEYPYDLNHGRSQNLLTYFVGIQIKLGK